LGHRAGFAIETFAELRIAGKRFGQDLMATMRSSEYRARYSSPIPPTPISETIS
jgi:hypothetical protein